MRNGYIIHTSTSVDICEIIKTGEKLIETCEGVAFQKTLKYHLWEKLSKI